MHRQRRRTGNRAASDPFAALGLPARPGLTDDDVRAAWRRIAAATHPDRDDGGDPVRFAAAAAAYAELRSSFSRSEALADMFFLTDSHPARRRMLTLMLRLLVAAAVAAGSFLAAGWSPGSVGVIAGALTWFAVTCFPAGTAGSAEPARRRGPFSLRSVK